MNSLRLAQLGVDHPHAEMYRDTIANHDGIELIGGYDERPDRAAELLASEGWELPLFGEVDEALAALRPDAVLVTLPNDIAPQAILTAANQGLGVFVEKPGAVSAAAFMPAHDAVRDRGVPFVAAYMRRFSPVATAMRDLIAEGVIGELVSAQITFATKNVAQRNATYLAGASIERGIGASHAGFPSPPATARHWLFDRARSGGGILHWLGVHWLDLLLFAGGEAFTHVSASLATRSPDPVGLDVEDVASVTLESASGMIATLTSAYVLGDGPDQIGIAIQGTKGWMQWNGVGPELRVQSDQPAWRSAPARMLRFEAPPMPGYSGATGWEAFERFRAAVQEGGSLPMDVTDALRVLELLDAIQRSGREGCRVAV